MVALNTSTSWQLMRYYPFYKCSNETRSFKLLIVRVFFIFFFVMMRVFIDNIDKPIAFETAITSEDTGIRSIKA